LGIPNDLVDNFSEQKPAQNRGQNNNDRRYILLGLRIVGEFGVTIAAPVVFFAWLGKRLDQKYGTEPWLLILGFVMAFGLSALIIWRRAKQIGKEYEALK